MGGINAGGVTTRQRVSMAGPGGKPIQVLLTLPAPGYNYGVRIDALQRVPRV